ncbi:MAG: hypothetical protein GYA35_00510, partial [Thermoanaerobaculaceae bacterium]|nr:hypothetical protein [Thermoanaerobaculaceae bacterium]
MKARKMGKIIIVLSFLLFSIISFSQTADESWVRIGVAFSGDITALAVSPDYETDTTIFIGVSGDGLWMSNDRGDSWTQCTAVPCDATVTGIALPQDYNFSGGDPCFAVTNEGYFYRSVDDFAGFTDVFSVTNPLNGQTYPMTSIVVGGISVFNNKVYIGLWGKGVYAHYSGGVGSAGWTYLGPDQINNCRSLTLSSEASQTLWASFNRDGGNAVLRYSGSGATWYSPNSYCPSEDVLVVRSSWVNPQYLWAGTSNLGMWRSTDGGNNWVGACDGQTAPNYVDYEVRAIRETPNSATDLEMWEGRSDGLRKSTSVGASCSDANPRAKINCIEFSPRYKMTGAVYCDAFVGTEQGLYRIECDNFPASRTPVVVDGKAVAMAHDGKGYFMGSLTGGFFKSLTGRRNMVQYNNFPNGKIPQITAICLHPAYNDEDNDCGDANTLFVAANFPDSPADNGVYASGDGGNSWIKLTGGQWPSQPVEVRDLAISPNVSTDYGLFAATNLYLYRWNGLTGSWSRCGEGGPTDIYWVALTPTYNGNATCSYVDGGTTYYGYPCNMVWIGAKNGNANVRLFYNLSNGNGQFTEL